MGTAMAVASVGSAVMGAKSAKDAGDLADKSFKFQGQMQKEQMDFSKEQWDFWKTNIQPLEQKAMEMGIDAAQLALSYGEDEYEMYTEYYKPLKEKMVKLAQEGLKDRTAEVTRAAAAEVDTTMERQREMMKRHMERKGVRPDSGSYQGKDRTHGLQQSATRASEVNKARERETNRLETQAIQNAALVNSMNNPMTGMPTGGSTLTAGNTMSGMHSAFGASAGLTNSAMNAAGAAAGGFGDIIKGGIGLWRDYNRGGSDSGGDWGTASGIDLDISPGELKFAKGGLVDASDRVEKADRMLGAAAAGTGYGLWARAFGAHPLATLLASLMPSEIADGTMDAQGGLVRGQEGRDKVPALIDGHQPAKLTSGEFVIPKHVVDRVGVKFFDNLIDNMDEHHQGVTKRKK